MDDKCLVCGRKRRACRNRLKLQPNDASDNWKRARGLQDALYADPALMDARIKRQQERGW